MFRLATGEDESHEQSSTKNEVNNSSDFGKPYNCQPEMTMPQSPEQSEVFEVDIVRRRAFVVVGMHRSGTSAMTRTLSLLGAALPERLMPPVAADNLTGFWESQAVADFNDEILRAQDSEWDDVFAFRQRQYLSNFDRVYLGRAVELLDQQFNGAEVIVLKDPRISVLAAFWDRALLEAGYDVHYVVMVRNPLEVAESLRARDGFPREKSFLLWSSYMIAIDRDTYSRSRTFVSYDHLISGWRAVQRRIEAQTGVPFPRSTASAAIEIDRFLDPGLHHHAAGANDLYASADVPDQVKALYRIFSQACDGESDLDRVALKAIEDEMKKLDLLVGPLFADMRGSARALTKKVAELTAAHAGASERADSFEKQLAAERALRDAESKAASISKAELDTRLSELISRLAAMEIERESLAAGMESKERDAAEVVEQLAAAEAERLRMVKTIEEKARTAARLSARLTDFEAELEEARELVSSAQAKVAASEDKLAERFREVAALTDLLEKSERKVDTIKRDADDGYMRAEAAAKVSEDKLAKRFEEVLALTNLLRQREERQEQSDSEARWLTAVSEHLANQPRKWSLMSAPSRRKHLLRRLRDAGLFDGDAYLRLHPDVSQAGFDPLDHYLRHGIHEGRQRNP